VSDIDLVKYIDEKIYQLTIAILQTEVARMNESRENRIRRAQLLYEYADSFGETVH